MSAIANVTRRGGVYHFRRAVPEALRRLICRRELVVSLRTGESDRAKLGAAQLYVASEILFAKIRSAPMLTDDQLARLVQDFYRTILDQENAIRLRAGRIDERAAVKRRDYFEEVAARARSDLAINAFDGASFVTEAMLRKQGKSAAGMSAPERAQVQQAILRAGIDLAEALKARYEGDFNYEPRDKLLKKELETFVHAEAPQPPISGGPVPARKPSPLLSEVGEIFREAQVRTKTWDAQTALQARATYRLFIDVCGDKPLAEYTRKDAGVFRERVERLPADYSKATVYKGLSVAQILEAIGTRPAVDQPAVISQTTVKRHFSALSALWASKLPAEEVTSNIFSGFRFANAKRASEQRDMWTAPELKALFSSPVWTGCQSPSRRSTRGGAVIKDAKFWLPLVAVFTGMRQKEICQLHVGDIRREDGINCIDINDAPPRKLKNANSARRVPIHSKLVELGFLDYVADTRAKKSERVFPELQPGGADGRLGHAYTKWFTRYRRDINIYREKLDFHSFRHTATTLLSQAGIEHVLIDQLTGHATPGETARYSKGATLEQLKKAIEAIDIGFDVSPLNAGGD